MTPDQLYRYCCYYYYYYYYYYQLYYDTVFPIVLLTLIASVRS